MAIAPILIPLIASAVSALVPLLFRPRLKQQPIDDGKGDDIRLTGSDYGSEIPRAWGTVKIAGNLIFSNGITHTIIDTPSGGGKGGVPQAPATRTHVYTSSVGILICRGQVVEFKRIWADADLLLGAGHGVGTGSRQAEAGTRTGGATIYADVTASGGSAVTNLGAGGKVSFDLSSIIPPPAPRINDPDEIAQPYTRISFFYKCATVTTATIITDADSVTVEFNPTGSNWTVNTEQFIDHAATLEFGHATLASPDLDYITVEKYWFIDITTSVNNARPYVPQYSISGVVNQDIIYPVNIDDPSEYYNAVMVADGDGKISAPTAIATEATRFYKGTDTQLQDDAIVGWLDSRYGTGEGVLRASAHRDLAWVMFENRTLKQGRLENFSFEVDCGYNTANDILADLCDDVGFTSGDYDFTQTVGLSQIGFIEHTNASRRALAEYLERYHFFRLAEIDGKIYSILDNSTSILTIDNDDLRCHNYGDEMPAYDAQITFKEERTLPRVVRVSILNPDIEYKNDIATARVFASTPAVETTEYTFPIVDTTTTARNVAERLLLKAHEETQTFILEGMPKLNRYAIGDVITINFDSVDTRLRIENKKSTLPMGKTTLTCVSVVSSTPTTYQDDFTTTSPQSALQLAAVTFPRNAVCVPIQSLPLQAKDRGKLGVYMAVCGRGRGDSENISLMREYVMDNYILQGIYDTPAIMGLATSTLATWATPSSEDTTNVLDIWFFNNVELESVTAPEILRFPTLNLIRVGDEWIQFRTATAQTLETNSPYRSKWRISNLMRGTFSTTAAIAGHAADEYCVVYSNAVKFHELNTTDIGEDINFKAVTNGQAIENATATLMNFTPLSNYAVSNLTYDRTFDANATSLNELSDIVGTMIVDLNL